MAKIIEFVTSYHPLIISIFFAVAGLLFILAGFITCRKLYAPLSGILGLVVGLSLHAMIPRDHMFIVAVMIAIACGVVGHENYRCGQILVSGLSTFIAGAVFVIRRIEEDFVQAVEGAGNLFETVPNKSSVLRLWYMRFRYDGDMKEAMSVVFKEENVYARNRVMNIFDDRLNMLQIGIGVCLLLGILAGLVSLLLSDYIVVASTALLGSVLLVSVIDDTDFLKQIQYNYKLVIFFIAGTVFQIAVNYKSIVGERQKKKRRGLYEKQR